MFPTQNSHWNYFTLTKLGRYNTFTMQSFRPKTMGCFPSVFFYDLSKVLPARFLVKVSHITRHIIVFVVVVKIIFPIIFSN